MIQTFEAVIDEQGIVRLLEDEPNTHPSEAAILSEAALAEDWNRPEEDAAWAYLQQAQ